MADKIPDFSILEQRPLLGLYFPASDATGGTVVLGQYVPVARARQSLQGIIAEYGLTPARGTIDGEQVEAVLIDVDGIPGAAALLCDGRSTRIAIRHAADYERVFEQATGYFDARIRPLR
jgi:hypothetical protein